MMFTADTILFREIQCKKTNILMFMRNFQRDFAWTQLCKNNDHTFFIALTLAGSLGRVLNTPPYVQTAASGPFKC